MVTKNILHIRRHHSVYLGDFGLAIPHIHAVPVLFIGLSGPISVKIEEAEAVKCYSALVDANVRLSVDCLGEHVATLYFDIDSQVTQSLKNTFFNLKKFVFDITDNSSHSKSFERKILKADLSTLFKYTITKSETPIDHRVAVCLRCLKENPHLNQKELARHVSLSVSRLNHLFKSNTGVSFRNYKLWSKVASFSLDVHMTRNFTASALNTGFSDSSHLSNSYRKTFGVTPSIIFSNLDEFEISYSVYSG